MKKLAYLCAAALFLTNISAFALTYGDGSKEKKVASVKTVSSSKHTKTTKTGMKKAVMMKNK